VSKNNIPTAKQYFLVVAVLTASWLGFLVAKNLELKQVIKETFGLSEPLQAAEDSFYNERVQHIFEQYCVGCHDDNKAKGDLRLDSFRQVSFGGKSGEILTGGEQSLLLERMLLPEDDRLTMPPYGRDRQTLDEIEVLKQWLVEGASGTLTAQAFPHAPQKVKKISFSKIDWHVIDGSRLTNASSVKELQQKYPVTIDYIARTSAYLELSGIALGDKLNDKVLADFKPVSSHLSSLDLRNTAVSDLSMPLVASMHKLTFLNVVGTKITPKGLEFMLDSAQLKKLVVDRHAITADIVKQFASTDIKLVVVERAL
jgi:hypothetical protein